MDGTLVNAGVLALVVASRLRGRDLDTEDALCKNGAHPRWQGVEIYLSWPFTKTLIVLRKHREVLCSDVSTRSLFRRQFRSEASVDSTCHQFTQIATPVPYWLLSGPSREFIEDLLSRV